MAKNARRLRTMPVGNGADSDLFWLRTVVVRNEFAKIATSAIVLAM